MTFSPLHWSVKVILLSILLFIIYGTLIVRSPHQPLQIVYRDDQWMVLLGDKQRNFSSAIVICQFGWFMVIRFDQGKKSYILPVYRDQVSISEYHQLCLLIRVS